MKNILSLLFVALLFLAGCDDKVAYDKALNEYAAKYSKEVDLAGQYLTMLHAHDFAPILEKTDPSLKTDKLPAILETTANLFPAQPPTAVKLVGLNRNDISTSAGHVAMTNLTYEYEFPGKWLQASVMLREADNVTVIAGLNVLPLTDSIENLCKFTFAGKGPLYYAAIALACIVPLFSLAALVLAVRTPIPKRKWLWIIFILFGLTKFTLNWATGDVGFQPGAFQLLGAGFIKAGPYGPLMLSVSVPLGAVIFFIRRKSWLKPAPK